jgi:transcriptional repressor NrdR
MRCVACNHKESKVIDSRLSQGGMSIRRRRQCLKCQFRFSTVEESEILDLTVVKRDGRREAYMREKLESGLRKAFQKRAITAENFKELVNQIERDLQRRKRNEVTTREIGEVVMNRLKHVDTVAYIRFASVYRAFEDVKTFQDALEHLAQSSKAGSKTARLRHKERATRKKH